MIRILAVVANGVVANTITADSVDDWPDAFDITDVAPRPGVGWVRTKSDWSPPDVLVPPARNSSAVDQRISCRAFRAKLGHAINVALELASEVPSRPGDEDEDTYLARRTRAATVRVLIQDICGDGLVDLACPEVRAAMLQLEALGAIPENETAKVLGAQVASTERTAA